MTHTVVHYSSESRKLTHAPLSPFYLCVISKMEKKEEKADPSTSSNSTLELELTEEKLPMSLSRQEVSRPIRDGFYCVKPPGFCSVGMNREETCLFVCPGDPAAEGARGTGASVCRVRLRGLPEAQED